MDTAIILGGVLVATVVVLGYLLFIWWLDRYEREPLWMVMLVFLWGGFGGTCLGCVISAPLAMSVPEFVSTVVVAPFVEEFTKGLVFIPLVLTHHFDNETDGLIYGAAAGLGFAAIENILYFMAATSEGAGAVLQLVVMRTLFSALVHCISSAALGMAIGYARHRSGSLRWFKYPMIGYLVAVANHAIWNGAAVTSGVEGLAPGVRGGVMLTGMALVAGAAVVMFVLTQLSLKREHDVIRHYLEQEAERGTLPHDHADIIPYWRKRRKSGWLPASVPHEEYVKAATLLAFRHYQREIAEGERRRRYTQDIERYRKQVRAMLARG